LPEGYVAELAVDSNPPFVVEDWLSANKLAQSGVHVVCALGTYLKPAVLTRRLEIGKVIVCMDPDKWGQIAATKIHRQLRSLGANAANLILPSDAKMQPAESLRSAARLACERLGVAWNGPAPGTPTATGKYGQAASCTTCTAAPPT
jgi:DNA primase